MLQNIYFDDVYPEIYAEFAAAESRLQPTKPLGKPQENQLFPANQRSPRQRSWSAMYRAMALAG